MASYDRTFTNRRTGATGPTERVYSRAFGATRRAARARGDRIVVENIPGARTMTITDRDLKWEARYVQVAPGTSRLKEQP